MPDQQLPTDLLEIRQALLATCLRMDLLELEVAMWKSSATREKNAWTYCEEAVAAAYGILPCEFHRKPTGPGRPKGNVQPTVRQAQYLLFSMLINVVGLNLNDVRQNYGSWVASYTAFWGELYNLVHRPRKLAGREQKTWELYAPKFRGAYFHMRYAMQTDGVWPPEFEDDLLPELSPIES